jgi:hypothetical protein
MPEKAEYHNLVKKASAAGFAMALVLTLAPVAGAQTRGTPTSVTSTGFGGRAINGTPPSVTSLGPHGFGSSPAPLNSRPLGSHPHHRPYGSVWAVPYYPYYDSGYYGSDDSASAAPDNDQYNGGPTIFDRRGSGTPRPPESYASGNFSLAPNDSASESSSSDSPQAETLLVFKDGHQLQIENYAIVGGTLYDLSAGQHRKFALADLDLGATVRQNEVQGVDFKLPSRSIAN